MLLCAASRQTTTKPGLPAYLQNSRHRVTIESARLAGLQELSRVANGGVRTRMAHRRTFISRQRAPGRCNDYGRDRHGNHRVCVPSGPANPDWGDA
jgi:hypothetical protein